MTHSANFSPKILILLFLWRTWGACNLKHAQQRSAEVTKNSEVSFISVTGVNRFRSVPIFLVTWLIFKSRPGIKASILLEKLKQWCIVCFGPLHKCKPLPDWLLPGGGMPDGRWYKGFILRINVSDKLATENSISPKLSLYNKEFLNPT